MKLVVKDAKAALTKTDLYCAIALEGEAVRLPTGVKIPALATKAFKGEFREARLTDAVKGAAARVLQVGLGKGKDADTERLRRAAAIAVKKATMVKAASCVISVSAKVEKAVGGAEAAGRAVAEAAVMAGYSPALFKSKKPSTLKSVTLTGGGARFRAGTRAGRMLGEANVFTRELQDSPGNLMRPRDMASRARKLASGSPRVTCKALTEAQMGKLGMGSLLSVSRGSSEPAFLVHLTYKPKRKAKGRICIVGKGLTFDAGGISLKPSAKMDEMKYDMSGGAAVLGIFHALAAGFDVPYEVHGLVPTSENLPDGKANKPGNIVTAMNKKTIEVLNTDAEGRLILCDALVYASTKIKPDTMVDMATLTGAVIVALGHELTGVMGNDEKLQDELVACGKDVGELVWPLPLLDCHKNQMKGTFADLRNINAGQGNGSTAGAAFLSNFVGEGIRWAHLDIAGTAWGSRDRDWVGGKCGSGAGARLLLSWLER